MHKLTHPLAHACSSSTRGTAPWCLPRWGECGVSSGGPPPPHPTPSGLWWQGWAGSTCVWLNPKPWLQV